MTVSPLRIVTLFVHLVWLGIATPFISTAQNELRVRGTVIDQTSGAPIASARLTLIDVDRGDTLAMNALTSASGRYHVVAGRAVGVDRRSVPSDYVLEDVSPNPVAGGLIRIRYGMPSHIADEPQVELYDILGRRVERSIALGSGVYFYRLRFDEQHVSDAKSFVMVGGGPLDVHLERVAPSGSGGFVPAVTLASNAIEVRFLIEKQGFVRLDETRLLAIDGENELDFSLEREAGAGKARVIVAARSSAGEPLPGVLVQVVDDELSGVTNNAGEVALDSVHSAIPVVLKLTKPGYGEQFKRIEAPTGGGQISLEAVMRLREQAVTVHDVELGAEEIGKDGVRIELPAGALVDGDGSAVTGSVSLSMTPIDVTDDDELETFPGIFVGFDETGEQGSLVTFGVAEFVIEQGGRQLDLAPGRTALLEVPLYVPNEVDGSPIRAGDLIPFWSLDEGSGLWVQEGTGTVVVSSASPTGLAVAFEVTHLSWWNLDKFVETVEAWWRVIVQEPSCKFVTGGRGYMRAFGDCVLPPLGTLPSELPPPPQFWVRLVSRTKEPGRPPMRGEAVGFIRTPGHPGELPPPPPPFPPPPCPEPSCIDVVFPDGPLDFPTDLEVDVEIESEPVPVLDLPDDLGESDVIRVINGLLEVTRPDTVITIDTSKDFKFKKAKAKNTFVFEPGTSPVMEIEFEVVSLEEGGNDEILELPAHLERGLGPGQTDTYLFHATDQEALRLDACRAFGSNLDGLVLLRTPGGLALDLQPIGSNCGSMRLRFPETGIYIIRIDNLANSPEAYTLDLEAVPLIQVDSETHGVFSAGGAMNRYAFEAVAGEVINLAYASGEVGANVDVRLRTSDGSQIKEARVRAPNTFGETETLRLPADDLYFIEAQVLAEAEGAYALHLYTVAEPATLSSAVPWSETTGSIANPADRHYFRFSASAGQVASVDVIASNGSLLDAIATVFREGDDFFMGTTLQDAVYGNAGGDVSANVREGQPWGHSTLLSESGSYVVLVDGHRLSTGSYTLRFNLVDSGPSLTVGMDSSTCAGAVTGMVRAAVRAAGEGGRVDVCAGSYREATSVRISETAGLTIAGAGADQTSVSMLVERGPVLADGVFVVESPNATLRDLAVVTPTGGSTGTAIAVGNGATGLLVEDCRITNGDRRTSARGIFSPTNRRADDVTVQRCTFEMQVDGNFVTAVGMTALSLRGDRIRVLDNVFNTKQGEMSRFAVSIAGDSAEVRGNLIGSESFFSGASEAVLVDMQGGGSAVIEDNEVLAYNVGIRVLNGMGAEVRANALGGRAPQFPGTNVFGISLSDVSDALLVANQIRGFPLLAAGLDFENSGGRAVNNRFSLNGGRILGDAGIRYRSTDGSALVLEFVNNSLRYEEAGSATSAVSVSADASSAPVTLLNNVLHAEETVAGSSGIRAEVPLERADHNLVFGFGQAYADQAVAGGADVHADAQFADDALRLSAGSPAIDAGTADLAPLVDFEGTTRPQGAAVDAGAHEWTP